MARTLKVRKPKLHEMRCLEARLEQENPVRVQRRAQTLLYYCILNKLIVSEPGS